MSTVSGMLLAVGESAAHGGINKMSLPVDGAPLLRRTVLTLLSSRLDGLVEYRSEHAGDRYYFRCAGCKHSFAQAPQRFLGVGR